MIYYMSTGNRTLSRLVFTIYPSATGRVDAAQHKVVHNNTYQEKSFFHSIFEDYHSKAHAVTITQSWCVVTRINTVAGLKN